MTGMFSGSKNSTRPPRYSGLNVQTSTQGGVIPIHYGQNRVAHNIIWYGGFRSVAHHQKSSGKGGGGGKGATSYTYYCDVIMALCEGVVHQVINVYKSSNKYTLADYDMALFNGTVGQAGWSYLQSNYPGQYLTYSGTAYIAVAQLNLGSSPDLPDFSYEIAGNLWGSVPNNVDANPADIMYDYVTNSQYGLSPGATWLDPVGLENYRQYCGAQGIYFSPYMSSQEQVTNTFQRWSQMTNTFIFWSADRLKFVPLGTVPLSLNGYTYTPNNVPIYDLTYDDFIVKGKNATPVAVDRIDPADGYNQIQFDIRDRNNEYNVTSLYWTDPYSISEYGQLQSNIVEANEICLQSIAQIAMGLLGARSVYIRNTYTFKLGYNYCLLEPGDIVTLTDPNIGLNKFPVRIRTVKEDTDQILTITAEELPAVSGIQAEFTYQPAGGAPPYNPDVDPGNVNPPAIFEPPQAVTNGSPEIWIGASGGPNWGAAQVYMSYDGVTYTYIGFVNAAQLQGELINTLPATADPDTTDTMTVDFTICNGIMPTTATQANADAFQTVGLVGRELIAYGSVAQGNTSEQYNFKYLRRGIYGSGSQTHNTAVAATLQNAVSAGATTLVFTSGGPTTGQFVVPGQYGIPSGASVISGGLVAILDQPLEESLPAGTVINFLPTIFTRVDQATVFSWPLQKQYIGQKLYFKFASVNVFGSGAQDLSDVVPYVYTPFGAAFTLPPPGVPTLTAVTTVNSTGTAVQSLTASWTPSNSSTVGNYIVEFSTDGETWSNSASVSGTTTSYTYPNVSENTNYYCRVAAVTQSGLGQSVWSTMTTPVNSGGVVIPIPAAPSNLSVTAGPGSATLNFTQSTTANVTYQAYYSIQSNPTFNEATAGPVGAGTGFTVNGLTAGTEYTFWVVAVNSAGNSSPSNSATVTPASGGTTGVVINGTDVTELTGGPNITLSVSGTVGAINLVPQPAVLMFSYNNGIPPANEVFFTQYIAGITLVLPINLNGSVAECGVAPTNNYVMSLEVNGNTIGSITFAAGSTNGTFIMTIQQTIAPGSAVSLVGPAIPDPTFSNPSITIVGTR